MKVFKFKDESHFYTISGNTLEEAEDVLCNEIGVGAYEVEEVPESKWDEQNIKFNEDNDMEKEGFYMSIREVMETEPMLLCTNDYSIL